jgi:hypothetical protein
MDPNTVILNEVKNPVARLQATARDQIHSPNKEGQRGLHAAELHDRSFFQSGSREAAKLAKTYKGLTR